MVSLLRILTIVAAAASAYADSPPSPAPADLNSPPPIPTADPEGKITRIQLAERCRLKRKAFTGGKLKYGIEPRVPPVASMPNTASRTTRESFSLKPVIPASPTKSRLQVTRGTQLLGYSRSETEKR